MKHLEPNDPRFTAKALGEEETRSVHPEAEGEFASLKEFSQELKRELHQQGDTESLTELQRAAVKQAAQPKNKKILAFPLWPSAIAATLMLGLTGILTWTVFNTSLQETAPRETDPNLAPASVEGKLDEVEIDGIRGRGSRDIQPGDITSTAGDLLVVTRKSEAESVREPAVATKSFSNEELLAVPPPQIVDGEIAKILRESEQRSQASQAGEVEMNELSPFTIESIEDEGYATTATSAASRLGTNLDDAAYQVIGTSAGTYGDVRLRDVASSSDVISMERRQDISIVLSAPSPVATGRYLRRMPDDSTFIREAYDRIVENIFKNPVDHPLSTFSIDVDTASYANMRRFLNYGQLPPADAVRIEELINYFPYDYAEPADETPFAVHVDAATAPWKPEHRLVRIALQGKTVDTSDRPDANLVFLIDVSGSMSSPNKLGLVKQSLNLLVEQMEARDRIAVVVYAGASGLALPSTTANNQETIKHAINNLQSGGSTNGGAGIELAYSVAQRHFIKDGINRVILCTDGDFNVGTTDRGSLSRLIEDKAKTGVFFSVLGFGMGNLQDATMEELSNKGNGNYGYVDSIKEARKVFVDEMLGTLMTIAKDVKIQVEFNPALVGAYRLIGYENRMLAKEDFNDDTKDAGEIGAGHRVTALYEIIPAGLAANTTASVDPLKYQKAATRETVVKSAELLTVKLRYKEPDADESRLIEQPFVDPGTELSASTDDFRFVTAVAAFGMLLRNSEYSESMTFDEVLDLARQAKGRDSGGWRSEFIELIEKARQLTPEPEVPTQPQPDPEGD